LGKLREHRAATSGAGELPILTKVEVAQILASEVAKRKPLPSISADEKREVRRMDIPIEALQPPPAPASNRNLIIVAASILGLLMVVGIALMLKRTSQPATDVVISTPTPVPSPSPTPSPSPSPSPTKEEKRPEVARKPEKKESKVGAVFSKFKKIIKKPF
jgi:hypothetical protein